MDKLAYEDALKEWKRFERYLVETRYGIRDPETGELLEHTYDDVIRRVIRVLKERTNLFPEAYYFLEKRMIIPASPVLMNLGSPRKNKTYFSCFPLGQVDDTMDSIMEFAVRMGKIYKAGGGVGIDLSKLRPRNSFVDRKQGYSSGPVGFLPLYDAVTGTISQANSRRGALLVTLDCKHPDAVMFAKCKWNESVKQQIGNYNLNNMNISLMVWNRDDLFTDKKLFDIVVDGMYNRGDPGLFFVFNQNEKTTSIPMKFNPYWSNPCGEYLSVANTSCSLITVNLPECFRQSLNDYGAFLKCVEKASYYATCIMSYINTFEDGYPDRIIFETNKEINPVGVGITGLHGLLILLGISYSRVDEVTDVVDDVYRNLLKGACIASKEMLEKGFVKEAKLWNEKFFERTAKTLGFDNGFAHYTLLTQMPTGTVSQFAYSASTGIEPLYSVVTNRKVRDFNNNWTEFKIVPLEAIEADKSFDELEKETALCLSGFEQIDIIASALKWITTNVSKTINVPADFPKDRIKELIEYAMEKELKSLTVFRDSSSEQILTAEKKSVFVSNKLPDIREGKTYKFRGALSLYITVNKIDDKVMEVFLSMGKAGSTISTMNKALGRVVSVALQNDSKLVQKIIDTLEGMQGDLTLVNSELGMTTSVPDALARVLKNEIESFSENCVDKQKNLSICPSCGFHSLKREGSCNKCLNCGYSSC